MEDLITYQITKKLKEKGFPIKGKEIIYGDNGVFIPTPTIYQVLKWLREEKHLEANGCYDNDEQGWMGYVCEMDVPDLYAFHTLKEHHKSYEDAALSAIEYVLDNLI